MAISMQQIRAISELPGSTSRHYIHQAVAAIVGPVATAGADVYRTSADSKQSRRELKQRRREFQALIPIQQQAQRQQALETIASVRRQQVVSGSQANYAPYLVAVFALLGLSLAAISLGKKK